MGKVVVKDAVKPEVFKPFTLEVTVETPEEYIDLWHRFNLSRLTVNKGIDDEFKKIVSSGDYLVSDIWSTLDKIHTGDYREKFVNKDNTDDDDF